MDFATEQKGSIPRSVGCWAGRYVHRFIPVHNSLHTLASADSPTPIYSHRCTLPNRTLWFGRASLYEDRVVLRGWTWRGRYHRQISLQRIKEVNWRPVPEGPNLILELHNGSSVALRLQTGGGLWNAKLHDLLDKPLLNRHSLSTNGWARQEKGQEVM